MEATSLKLLFIVAMMFPATNPLTLEDYANCSLTFGRISTDQVAPIRLDVTLVVMPQRKILSGVTDITIDVKKPTTNITLHAHNLEIDMACTFIMKPGAKPRCHEQDAAYKLWQIVYCVEIGITNLIFTDFISPGQYILHIEHFSLLEKNENEMIYPYTWINETRWIVTNIYSPNAIRRLFPSWEEATIKEYLHIKVMHDISYKVFLNVPVWFSYDEEYVRRTFFTDIYQTSTHSITFMFVRDLITNTKQYDMNYLWQESNAMAALEHAHIVAYHTTLYFNWVINITLSEILKKIDHVVLPICPMKSAGRLGLIVYREKDVTYQKEVDSPGRRIDIAKLVSYEMSRQLFVGIMNSHLNIEDKWFDEILASFYSFYVLEKIWLGEEMMELFVVQNLQTALDSDIYLELKPTIHKTKSDYGIDGLLYPLLYHKKAFALIRMMLHLFTPQKFDEIIRKYVQSRDTNFWTIVEEVYPHRYDNKYTMKEIMDSWLTEIHHPEMHFIRNYNKKTVTYNAISFNNTSNFKIPFTYATTSSLQFYDSIFFWCEGNETKSISNLDSYHFFLINMEQFGYYRVNYDSQNWLLLAAHLQFATSRPIPVLNRAQIVNDAFYFTTTGRMEPQLFFDVIKFLNNETSYIVWHPMFNILSYMSAFLKHPVGESAKTNFMNMLDALLRNVGYEEHETDKEMTMPLRLLAIKWACEFGHEECRKVAAEKLIAYIHNSEQNIITRWTNWMYCTGMMDVNMTVWELIWQQGLENENMEILERLTCVEDEYILLHYLQLMSNITHGNNATKLPIEKIHRSIIKKHIEKQNVLNYFLNNLPIIDRFPHDFAHLFLLDDIVMNVHRELLLGKISTFITNKFFNDLGYKLWGKIQKMIEVRRGQLIKQRRKFRMFYY